MASKSSENKKEVFLSVMDRIEKLIIDKSSSFEPKVSTPVDPVTMLENPDNKETLDALLKGDFGCQTISVVHLVSKIVKDEGIVKAYHAARKSQDAKVTIPKFIMVKTLKKGDWVKRGETLIIGNDFSANLFLDSPTVYFDRYKSATDFNEMFQVCTEDEIRSNMEKIRTVAEIDIDRIWGASGFTSLRSYLSSMEKTQKKSN